VLPGRASVTPRQDVIAIAIAVTVGIVLIAYYVAFR
jgi:hypothetical protein